MNSYYDLNKYSLHLQLFYSPDEESKSSDTDSDKIIIYTVINKNLLEHDKYRKKEIHI